MAKVKVEVLCNNIFLDGAFHKKGDTVSIDQGDADVVKKLDDEAGRDFRLKVTKTRTRKPKMETENGENS